MTTTRVRRGEPLDHTSPSATAPVAVPDGAPLDDVDVEDVEDDGAEGTSMSALVAAGPRSNTCCTACR